MYDLLFSVFGTIFACLNQVLGFYRGLPQYFRILGVQKPNASIFGAVSQIVY
jgi:hypothetical protein